MEQTALEWLYDQIENKGKCIYEVFKQAKAMEKEQKGYSEKDINKILGSNLLRVLEANE